MQLHDAYPTESGMDTTCLTGVTSGTGHQNKRNFHDVRLPPGRFAVPTNVKRVHRFGSADSYFEEKESDSLGAYSRSVANASSAQATRQGALTTNGISFRYSTQDCSDDHDVSFCSTNDTVASSPLVATGRLASPPLHPAVASPVSAGSVPSAARPAVYVNTGVYHHVILRH